MNITPSDLPHHLKQHPRNTFFYLITGDEVLLVEESVQRIVTVARAEGYAERCVIETETADAIDRFLSHTQNLSFLSAKKIIDVRFHQKITAAWTALLIEMALKPDPNQIILLRMAKLSRAETQTKWYKTFENNGCVVTIWPLKHDTFLRWLNSRLETAELKISQENLVRIAASTEGNLLAAAQIIEKLQLIQESSSEIISDEMIREALSDHTHFNVFELCDAILAQKPGQCLKILATLKNQGTEPPIILWALMQDVRHLAALSTIAPAARSSLYPKRGIWGPRQALFQQILSKIPPQTWNNLLGAFVQRARHIDALIKGMELGDLWMELEIFCLTFSRITVKTS